MIPSQPATQSGNSATSLHGAAQKLAARWQKFQNTKAYDLAAIVPLIVWYGSSALQQLPDLIRKFAGVSALNIDFNFIISILAEVGSFIFVIMILVFLVLRSPVRARAKGMAPSIVATLGAFFAVTVVWLPRVELGFTMSIVSLLLILTGIVFSAYTMLFLGRSFSIMPQARELVTSGPYAIVRHPLYLGEGLAIVGTMLQYISPLALVIVGLQCAFQLQRMKNEEAVLMGQYPEYRDYMARTARVIPGVY
jgi:protein-S-isoprenylcysteine O-methyltransferase Ste14